MATKKQPKKTVTKFRTIDFRMTHEELEKITQAALAEARDKGIVYSRNNFCLRAVLAAACNIKAAK
jgi:uncharacterized protein (DUF1778 family)